jgi:hypothetical protein
MPRLLIGEHGAEQYGGSAGGAALRAAPEAHCSVLSSIVRQHEVRNFRFNVFVAAFLVSLVTERVSSLCYLSPFLGLSQGSRGTPPMLAGFTP